MTQLLKDQGQKEMSPNTKREIAGAESTRPVPVFTPTVDIFETEESITVLADLPGVRTNGLEIDLHENVLSIDAAPQDLGSDDEQPVLREYETGAFHREFRLSNVIDQGQIDAELRDGVLRLTLAKAKAAQRRKIEIKSD